MPITRQSRRRFLQTTSSAAVAAVTAPYFFSTAQLVADDAKAESKNDRLVLGCIGTGSRWGGLGLEAMKFADCIAVCDVDARHAAGAVNRVQEIQGRQPVVHDDYRQLLDRDDIDVVTIATTDHWHTKIAVEAMQSGKDVYCEKPLTLTIDEGRQICRTVERTGRVFQVGTQQRTDMGQRFLQAIAMIRDGRIGTVQRVTCDIGGAPTSGALPIVEVPAELQWEKWLGQAPLADYRSLVRDDGGTQSRGHFNFRWWYEYSGGKLTDWGAHHVDIAQWAIGQNGPGEGVKTVEPLMVEHPVELQDGMPVLDDRYNTATGFHIKCTFSNEVEMDIVSESPNGNGILFEGTEGRFHVARGRISGKPFEELSERPLPEDAIAQVYGGKQPTSHMQNFVECIKSREQPISDVFTHHRALTTCHLSNIAMRLNRPLTWDAKTEQILGDDDANNWQRRQPREGYEIDA